MGEPLAVLVLTTTVTAAFHTLIPDHWLPFVLVARTEGWGARRTAMLTAGSAILHVTLSIGLGVAALFVGRGAEAAVGVGESLGRISAAILSLFGFGYAGWFLLRGGHQHSFGMHPHHAAEQRDPPFEPHPHDVTPPPAAAPDRAAAPHAAGAGGRGEASVLRRGVSGLSLAGIVGFNPCVLIIPYLYLAGGMGIAALVTVAAAFAVSTVGCMVGVALLGLKGTARLESPFLIRYGEVVSGVLIGVTGLAVAASGL